MNLREIAGGVTAAGQKSGRRSCSETSAGGANLALLSVAAVLAALSHLVILLVIYLLLERNQMPDSPALRVQLQAPLHAEQTSDATHIPVPASEQLQPAVVDKPPARESTPAPALVDPAHAAPSNTLQKYLNGGALPNVALKPQPAEPGNPASAVFHPALRAQSRRARERAPSKPLYRQGYTLPGGAEFERQGNNCFIGRDIPSPSGPLHVWYPIACRKP